MLYDDVRSIFAEDWLQAEYWMWGTASSCTAYVFAQH